MDSTKEKTSIPPFTCTNNESLLMWALHFWDLFRFPAFSIAGTMRKWIVKQINSVNKIAGENIKLPKRISCLPSPEHYFSKRLASNANNLCSVD